MRSIADATRTVHLHAPIQTCVYPPYDTHDATATSAALTARMYHEPRTCTIMPSHASQIPRAARPQRAQLYPIHLPAARTRLLLYAAGQLRTSRSLPFRSRRDTRFVDAQTVDSRGGAPPRRPRGGCHTLLLPTRRRPLPQVWRASCVHAHGAGAALRIGRLRCFRGCRRARTRRPHRAYAPHSPPARTNRAP